MRFTLKEIIKLIVTVLGKIASKKIGGGKKLQPYNRRNGKYK